MLCGGRFPGSNRLIGGEGVLHLLDLTRLAEDSLTGNDGGDLVQTQRVVLDGQRGMDAADAVFATELRDMGRATQRTDTTDLASDLRDERENGGSDGVGGE